MNDLLGYMCHIVRASHRYKWPSWVVYDQNFRIEAADHGTKEWSRMDPSLYAQCFTGQAKSQESWCKSCHSLDHDSESCPLKPPQPKRFKSSVTQPLAKSTEPCKNYNRYNGDCHHGAKCKYAHVCSTCGEHHPATQCKKRSPSYSGSRSEIANFGN